jgi:hypothetical protein
VKEVLEYIAKNLVDDPEAVEIEVVENGDSVTLRLSVSAEDMGKIIGRRGPRPGCRPPSRSWGEPLSPVDRRGSHHRRPRGEG